MDLEGILNIKDHLKKELTLGEMKNELGSVILETGPSGLNLDNKMNWKKSEEKSPVV
jgi:hypothetical protein